MLVATASDSKADNSQNLLDVRSRNQDGDSSYHADVDKTQTCVDWLGRSALFKPPKHFLDELRSYTIRVLDSEPSSRLTAEKLVYRLEPMRCCRYGQEPFEVAGA